MLRFGAEEESVLEVKQRLAMRRGDVRYLLASDSQVALAALVKGRSSSYQLNQLLNSGPKDESSLSPLPDVARSLRRRV